MLSAQNLNWENPAILVPSNARFVRATSGGGIITLVWQEFEYRGNQGFAYLSVWTSTDAVTWKKWDRFAGPFAFTDKETQIFSVAQDQGGNIYIAAAVSEKKIQVMFSSDSGETFRTTNLTTAQPALSPQIFIKNTGSFYLFVNYQDDVSETLSIYFLLLDRSFFNVSESPFQFGRFITESETDLGFNFLPWYCMFRGKEYVVIQARIKGDEQTTYQLYTKTSIDGGKTWTRAEIITSFQDPFRGASSRPIEFDNQRPFMAVFGNTLYVTWERKYLREHPQIYLASLDISGKIETGSIVRITDKKYTCLVPQLFSYQNTMYLLWFESPGNERVVLAKKGDYRWEETNLSYNIAGDSRFPSQVQTLGYLYFFWENRINNWSQLVFLRPDQYVEKPAIYPGNFNPDRASSARSAVIRWSVPVDSSGIAAFYYSWSQKPPQGTALSMKPGMTELSRDTTSRQLETDLDGVWYFTLLAEDFAGNLSSPGTVRFLRDTQPPEKPVINLPETDDAGFLVSNTFTVSWVPPPDADTGGYAYGFRFVTGNIAIPVADTGTGTDAALPVSAAPEPGTSIMLFNTDKSFYNLDNGVYAFSVRAIDQAGNAGPVSSVFFKLDKYVPVTIVTDIIPGKDENDETVLKIMGRGFLSRGMISSVYLDRDGLPPYDYTYRQADNAYTLVSDREIADLKITEIDEDVYRLVVFHETRGVYVSGLKIKLEPTLTVKIGEFPPPYVPDWKDFSRPLLSVSINEVFVWLFVAFLGLLFFVSMRKIAVVVREGRMIEAEVFAIMSQEEKKKKKIKRATGLKVRGLGLRFKFTFLITFLVILVILMLSVTLGFYMIRTERTNLTDGLKNQVRVLMGSLASGTQKYLPLQNTIELGDLPDQSGAMEDALSVIITGISRKDSTQPDKVEYVWAHNDPDIRERINTDEYQTGESILKEDGVSALIPDLTEKINKRAIDEVTGLLAELRALIGEAANYFGRNDPASIQKLAEIEGARQVKQGIVNTRLKNISTDFEGIVPAFNTEQLEKLYTFYKPVVFRRGDEDIFYRGMIRVTVTTERITGIMSRSINQLLYQILIISLVAIGMGIAGAVLLASITIGPIKKLARGVALIRDTEDKSLLKNHTIDIRQKDEIRLLADTINQMTQGLVRAAAASKDLTVGKEVQKMFIPLEKDAAGKKGSTGSLVTEHADFYGYYEGAKGVSGDYFDFVRLDSDHYAVIKCDVAGKGVPAALIMVEVATIFTDYFRGWTMQSPGIHIDKLVYKINDMIEERGFKGRFAALIIIIINIKTGTAYFCNAGDSIQHMYIAAKGKMEQTKLPEAPATGVFPSMLIEMQAGFKQVTKKLTKGDILFLFSDGFDEAKRLFRNERFQLMVCTEPSLKDGEFHNKTHKKGENGEEMGIDRIYSLIESVKQRRVYELVKEHNPVPDEKLTFDFTSLKGNVQDIIMAMVSVEKVYRLYRNPAATAEDKVLIDRKIDEFLQEHFLQYGSYFSHQSDSKDAGDYITCTHLNEDEQYDDLTILAIEKK